jgi:short-subunit dehydrogenase
VRISEGLHYDLLAAGSKLRASVLCPGLIATRIVDAGRNRPAELQNEMDEETRRQRAEQTRQRLAYFNEHGMPPSQVAGIVFDAIREERFYILTHPNIKERVRTRMEDIIAERNPTPPV